MNEKFDFLFGFATSPCNMQINMNTVSKFSQGTFSYAYRTKALYVYLLGAKGSLRSYWYSKAEPLHLQNRAIGTGRGGG